jgi:hypothetical protein
MTVGGKCIHAVDILDRGAADAWLLVRTRGVCDRDSPTVYEVRNARPALAGGEPPIVQIVAATYTGMTTSLARRLFIVFCSGCQEMSAG